jgi:hypothetical protein
MSVAVRRILLPTFRDIPWGFLKFPGFIYGIFYYIGIIACIFSKKGRAILAFYLGYALPFLIIGFLPELNIRFFIPSITLAFVISAFGIQELIVRGAQRISIRKAHS